MAFTTDLHTRTNRPAAPAAEIEAAPVASHPQFRMAYSGFDPLPSIPGWVRPDSEKPPETLEAPYQYLPSSTTSLPTSPVRSSARRNQVQPPAPIISRWAAQPSTEPDHSLFPDQANREYHPASPSEPSRPTPQDAFSAYAERNPTMPQPWLDQVEQSILRKLRNRLLVG